MRIWKSRWFRLSILFIVLSVCIGEIVARYYLGLGATPVYIKNEKFEYIYAPNQDVYRFGNRVITNEFSMRSKPIRAKDKIRVLLIGDSVVNGGPHVDHDDIASTLLEKALQKNEDSARVLNISAGSWGPDNAFAYVSEYGHFNADLIVLVFSSHDYNDNMHHRDVVGRHANWPDTQPDWALIDGIEKYAWPKIKSFFGAKEDEYAYLNGFDDSAVNSGWQSFVDYSKNNDIQLLIYVHPEKKEIEAKTFNAKGKKLIALLESMDVDFVSGLEKREHLSGYRDNIHLNSLGHKKMAEILEPLIADRVSKQEK